VPKQKDKLTEVVVAKDLPHSQPKATASEPKYNFSLAASSSKIKIQLRANTPDAEHLHKAIINCFRDKRSYILPNQNYIIKAPGRCVSVLFDKPLYQATLVFCFDNLLNDLEIVEFVKSIFTSIQLTQLALPTSPFSFKALGEDYIRLTKSPINSIGHAQLLKLLSAFISETNMVVREKNDSWIHEVVEHVKGDLIPPAQFSRMVDGFSIFSRSVDSATGAPDVGAAVPPPVHR
jgi:hypothetical protein